MQQIRAHQLAEWLSDGSRPQPVLLDVREPWEVELVSLPGSLHVPMPLVPLRRDELDADAETVVICHHGVRSMQVANYLERQGFPALFNLVGGIDAWAAEVDPNLRRY